MQNEVERTVEDVDGSLDRLFKAGAHFGYSKARRHPAASSFIFGTKSKTDIIDLNKTLDSLNRALSFISDIGSQGKTILWVGNKFESRKPILAAAEKTNMPYYAERWIGGTLTNFSEIKKRTARLESLESKREKGELDVYTKKEQGVLGKELADLKRKFGGIVNMKRLPDALFVVDSKDESIAVEEATALSIPIVSISGSDCDLTLVDYPIVANDSSSPSIKFFVEKAADAYLSGLSGRKIQELGAVVDAVPAE